MTELENYPRLESVMDRFKDSLGDERQRLLFSIAYKLGFDHAKIQNIENEIDVSDATEVKHDAYAVDGDSYASGGTSEISEHTSSAAMEIITEAKEVCSYCGGSGYDPYEYGAGIHVPCPRC